MDNLKNIEFYSNFPKMTNKNIWHYEITTMEKKETKKNTKM